MATRSNQSIQSSQLGQAGQVSGAKRPRELEQENKGLRSLSSLRNLLESTAFSDFNQEQSSNQNTDAGERKTKQLKQPFIPTGNVGDSRWRCVPGPFTRECVEYKIGEMIGRTEEEQKRFGNPEYRGIYSDYASKGECNSQCETLSADQLSLVMSMLAIPDVKNTILATRKFPQISDVLQDSFKEAKEAKDKTYWYFLPTILLFLLTCWISFVQLETRLVKILSKVKVNCSRSRFLILSSTPTQSLNDK